MSTDKNATSAREATRSQSDAFRGGYAAGKVSSVSALKPPPASVTMVKPTGKSH